MRLCTSDIIFFWEIAFESWIITFCSQHPNVPSDPGEWQSGIAIPFSWTPMESSLRKYLATVWETTGYPNHKSQQINNVVNPSKNLPKL